MLSVPPIHYACRTDSRFAPSQWETSLQSKAVSHWLGVNLESTLCLHPHLIAQFRLIIRLQIPSGPWFNKKMPTYQYRKSYCGDKTVVRSSYLHNGISYTGKMASFYWISRLVPGDTCPWFISYHITFHGSFYAHAKCHYTELGHVVFPTVTQGSFSNWITSYGFSGNWII